MLSIILSCICLFLGVPSFIIGVSALVFFLTFLVSEEIKNLFLSFLVLIICVGVLCLALYYYPLINGSYIQVGKVDSIIIVTGLPNAEHYIGNRYHQVKSFKVVFTENTEKIGKFYWALGWTKYLDIKEDVKKIIGERDGLIYFVSKSTDRVMVMKKR